MIGFRTSGHRQLALIALLLFSVVSCSRGVKELTIRVRSPMYPDFKEDHKVKMYEKFNISDTDLEAVVVEFLPDFAIDTTTSKAISRSDTLNNPAAKVLLIQGPVKRDEVWAFPPGMVPHYSPRSFIGFELIDYKTGSAYKKPEAKTPPVTEEDE